MGSKTDGFIAENMKSLCCKEDVRIKNKEHVTEAWCKKCGNYIYIKPVKILVALYSGDLEGVNYMNGYLPKWLSELITQKGFLVDENSHMKEIIEENTKLKEKIKELEEEYEEIRG